MESQDKSSEVEAIASGSAALLGGPIVATGIDPAQVRRMLVIVDGYVQKFQPPLVESFLRQVMTVAAGQLGQELQGFEIDQLVQEGLRRFDPMTALYSEVSPEVGAIAPIIEQQLQDFSPDPGAEQVMAVLDAYVQKSQLSVEGVPAIRALLYPVAQEIVRTTIAGEEIDVERLANQAILKFDLKGAIAQVIPPEIEAVAVQIIDRFQQGKPEELTENVLAILNAYAQANLNELELGLYQVVKQILARYAGLNLNPEQVEEAAVQVMFRFNRQSGSVKSPDQKAREIATQLTTEVARFRQQQAQVLKGAGG